MRRAAFGSPFKMSALLHFHEQAEFLRESSGSNIEKALRKAVKVLAKSGIPHYVCGGFAVQEHGYPRFTQDVDLIVPDRTLAQEALCTGGFDEGPGSVIDPETRVRIDLLPGGERFDLGPVALPVPTVVSDEPRILTLEALISTKLSAYTGRGIDRAQDYADVVKLIQANALPRQYDVARDVRALYEGIWDELHSGTAD